MQEKLIDYEIEKDLIRFHGFTFLEEAYRRGYRQGFFYGQKNTENSSWKKVYQWSHDIDDLTGAPFTPCENRKFGTELLKNSEFTRDYIDSLKTEIEELEKLIEYRKTRKET